MKFKVGDKVRISVPSDASDIPFNGAEGFVKTYEAHGFCWVRVPSIGEHLVHESRLERIDAVHNVPAGSGGCWYCETIDDSLVFSWEFDTFVHERCIAQAMERDPDDAEALIMGDELGVEGAAEALQAMREREKAEMEGGEA